MRDPRRDAPSTLGPGGERRPLPPLPPELARLMGWLGLESMRIFRVDLAGMHCLVSARAGVLGDLDADHRPLLLDNVFPGGAAMLARLGPSQDPPPLVHRNSPRRWVVAWIEAPGVAVLAAVHTVEGLELTPDRHGEEVRLLCTTALRIADSPSATGGDSGPAWPLVDRRARRGPSPLAWAVAALSLAGTALSLWLALSVWPAQQLQAQAQARALQHQHALAEQTLVRSLTATLAGGDYGEVQAQLGFFGQLGYFPSAVVANARGKVVALVGSLGGAQAGADMPAADAATLRVLDLGQGEQRGRLLLPRPDPQPEPGWPGSAVRAALLALAAAGVLAAAALLLPRRRRRQRTV